MLTILFQDIIEISIIVGIAILLLVLLSTKLNRTFVSKWKYWIWLLLAIRLLIPFNFSLPQAPVQLSVAQETARPFSSPTFELPQIQNEPQQAVAPNTAPRPATVVSSRSSVIRSPLDWAAVIWAVGFVAILLYHAFSYLNCKRLYLRWSSRTENTHLLTMLDQLQMEMNINKAVIPLVCKKASGPMMIGFFKHYLLLPSEDYRDSDLYYMLKHELIHLKRHDIWYKLVLLLACSLHWFNPLVYLMFHEAGKDLELACDDEVVKGLPIENRREYSETIFAFAQQQNSFRNTMLSTYFKGSARTLKERFSNLLGTHAKRRGVAVGFVLILCTALAGGLVACINNTAIDLNDGEALRKKYLSAPFISILLSESWDSPEEMEADRYVYYFAADRFNEGLSFEGYETDADYGILLPAEEVELLVRSRFDVSTEFLRTATTYIPERNAYAFLGLGGAAESYFISAKQSGRQLSIEYGVLSPIGNPLGDGVIHLQVEGDNYKYTSCEYSRAISYTLTFPPADRVVVTENNMAMRSGGRMSTEAADGEWKDYDGESLESVIDYYQNEVFPQLGATGSEIPGKYENGWGWEGSYQDGKPLTIDATYDNPGYIITVVFDVGAIKRISPYGPMIEAAPVNLYDLDIVTRAYVWPLIHTGNVSGYSWNSPSEIAADDLIDICAYNNLLDLPTDPPDLPIFSGGSYADMYAPANLVEAAIQKHFDVTVEYLQTASQYDPETDTYAMYNGWGGGWAYVATEVRQSGNRLIIDVGVSSDGSEPVSSNTLTIELQDGQTVRYISNRTIDVAASIENIAAINAEVERQLTEIQNAVAGISVNSQLDRWGEDIALKAAMEAAIANLGYPVSIGNANMPNYEKVTAFFDRAAAGEDAAISVFSVRANNGPYISGTTYIKNENGFYTRPFEIFEGEINIYDAVYPLEDLVLSQNGNLIAYRNSDEGDGFRVIPLPEEYRRAYLDYADIIAFQLYYDNIMGFDWSEATGYAGIDFALVFENLWDSENGATLLYEDSPYYQTGPHEYQYYAAVPAEVFEGTLQRYFNISTQALRGLEGEIYDYETDADINFQLYDPDTGTYYVQGFRGGGYGPTTEVWGITQNPNGSLSLKIAAVALEFRNDGGEYSILTVMPQPDGSYRYVSHERLG